MLATLSAESQIKNVLRELNCAESIFAAIAGVVSRSRLAQALAGQKAFDQKDAERLLEVVGEMKTLQAEVCVPIDWTRVSEIQNALLLRRIQQIAAELGDDRFNAAAQQATQTVKG
jgi:hypothetical protein